MNWILRSVAGYVVVLAIAFLVMSMAYILIKDFVRQVEEMLNRVLYEEEIPVKLEKEK